MSVNEIDPLLHYLLSSWQILAEQATHSADDIPHANEKWQFILRLYQEAFSPDVLPVAHSGFMTKMLETGGVNILEGFKNYLDDLIRGKGRAHLPLTDENAFTLGKDIACTPGNIIFQNDLMQLIHYTPTTKKNYNYPLLIIPPWINKYYILDLQPHNSMVRWLVEQGVSVFMISWVNPSSLHRDKTFEDYLFEGALTAIETIQKLTQKKYINTAAYCIGGTLQACLLAYLAKINKNYIKSATFFTTLLDFSQPGDLGLFIDSQQFDLLKKYMDNHGYLDGSLLTALFTLLRSKDLLWPAYIKHYLTQEKMKPSDFLFWNADSTNIAAKVHAFYLEKMYLKNILRQPNAIRFKNVAINLSDIQTPCWFVACERDHIAPWQSCYQSCLLIKSSVQFILCSAGHVAGVVTPPSLSKYSYRSHDKLFNDPNEFLSHTNNISGSWWPAWFNWLKQFSGKLMPYKQMNCAAIEPAPGSYVKQKCS